MDADTAAVLRRVKIGVIGFTEEQHKSIMKAAQGWGSDTSATDKALRNCVQGTALGVIENLGMRRRQRLDVFTEVSIAAFSGYVLGRELLGTESARPSYSSSAVEEKDNAVRIHDRAQAWPSDTLLQTFDLSEELLQVIQTMARTFVFREVVGTRRAKSIMVSQIAGSVGFAMAEEDLFGPFKTRSPRGAPERRDSDAHK